MKPFTAAALTGLGLALAGCSVGQQTSAGLTQGYGNIPVSIQGDLPAVQEREVAQAAAAAECVVGRHAMIQDYIAANRTASAVGVAVQAAAAAAQLIQDWSSTSPGSDLEQGSNQ